MDLSIVIPCLNEKQTIKKVIERAFKFAKKSRIKKFEILVSDNGSSDGSQQIIKKLKVARIVEVPIRGYGAALHWGILNAKGKFVLFADGDLSYDFKEIKKFNPYLNQKVDLVLGSRLRGKIQKGSMPFLNRYLGTPILTFLIRSIYGINTSDCNSGMRMIRKSFYKKLNMKNSGMEWASELLIKTALNHGQYKEVPINFFKDKRTRPPHLVPWSDGWRHFKAIILLKPNILAIPIIAMLIFSLAFIKRFPDFGLFGLLVSAALTLSFIAVKMLHLAINDDKSRLILFVEKVPIVIMALMGTTLWFIFLIIFPSFLNNAKHFVTSLILMFDIWVFHIETIKTHLINRLPDKL